MAKREKYQVKENELNKMRLSVSSDPNVTYGYSDYAKKINTEAVNLKKDIENMEKTSEEYRKIHIKYRFNK